MNSKTITINELSEKIEKTIELVQNDIRKNIEELDIDILEKILVQHKRGLVSEKSVKDAIISMLIYK